MKRKTRVGLVTSGGDCQGLNAALRGVGKALFQYVDNVEVFGMTEAAESGEVQRLVLAGSSDCFDITLGKHAHMVCSRCGAISDVDVPDTSALQRDAVGVKGGRIDACHVQFFGLCPECNREEPHQNQ